MRSTAQHIALERARVTCSVLRKSAFWREQLLHDESTLRKIHALQDILRVANEDSFDPVSVVSPFLAIIQEPYLAGPYKLIALDTIQIVLSCNILMESDRATSVLSEIVDAVTRCKFVQTDPVGDELVTLRLIQVLHEVVKSQIRVFLNDAGAWDIIESCYTVLVRGTYRPALNQVSEQVLMDTVRLVFSSAKDSALLRLGESPDSVSPNGLSLGLPVAVKVLGFFVNILKKHIGDNNDASAASPDKKDTNSSSPPPPPSPSNEAPQLLGDYHYDKPFGELLLALKVINCMIISDGNIHSPRDTILKCLPLASLIRDDLGLCLTLLASNTRLPTAVLQSVLNMFSTLVLSLGPILKVLVESFLVHIYLKALNQLATLLEDYTATVTADPNKPKPQLNPIEQHKRSMYFTPDQLEMILESLLDMISDSSFLSMTFVSFDCDPARLDIFQPMFAYLVKCSKYSLCFADQPAGLGSLEVVTNMALQCLAQVVSSLSNRCQPSLRRQNADENSEHSGEARRFLLSLNLRASRAAKKVLAEASHRFEKKSSEGLKYLQSVGALPTPLTPQSVASFLRLSPYLAKESIGSYLGELGSDTPKYESDGKQFHRDVLLSYVHSFPLNGQSVLSCVRVFLSAFRLPGEAQQIDRILNAFSEHCFACATECQDGVVENVEVAYLLSFSIIMLNTDRHNPNIRADRKMTLEQFIKNNLNYGSDVKQTKNLPPEYLETIYSSINNYPLRTEKNDESGVVTAEGWVDAQEQALMDPEKGLLVTISHDSSVLTNMKSCIYGVLNSNASPIPSETPTSDSSVLDSATVLEQFYHSHSDAVSKHAVKVLFDLLVGSASGNAFQKSVDLFGHQELVDADLAECLWQNLVSLIISPFVLRPTNGALRRMGVSGDHGYEDDSIRSVTLALELALHVIKISNWYRVEHVVDTIMMLLADFAAMLNGSFVELVSNVLLGEDSVANMVAVMPTTPVHDHSARNKKGKHEDPLRALRRRVLRALKERESARAAYTLLLTIVNSHPTYLSENAWFVVFHSFNVLRDAHILPKELVCSQRLQDEISSIPLNVIRDFEERMNVSNMPPEDPSQSAAKHAGNTRKPRSILQGLGEALFGAAEDRDDRADSGKHPSSKKASSGQHAPVSVTSRWDFGYAKEESSESQTAGNESSGTGAPAPVHVSPLSVVKRMLDESNVRDIVNDSKFLDDDTLIKCMRALTQLSDRQSGWAFKLHKDPSSNSKEPSHFDWSWDQDYSVKRKLSSAMESSIADLSPPSAASASWLETLVVEFSYRNRDRIGCIWPSLALHYVRAAVAMNASMEASNSSVASHSPKQHQPLPAEVVGRSFSKGFSYVDERRIVGAIMIVTKMMSRQQLLTRGLNLLHALLCNAAGHSSRSYVDWLELQGYDGNFADDCSMQFYMANASPGSETRPRLDHGTNRGSDFIKSWPKRIISELSSQIAVATWHMLTANASTLSHIQLNQWQQLFDIISIASNGDSFSAGKAFECMAWLIHEPQLRGEVPMFSVNGVSPLILNPQAPESVSIGAIQLLYHLHNRLEVLIDPFGTLDSPSNGSSRPTSSSGDEQGGYVSLSDASDTEDTAYEHHSREDAADSMPVLWESCWLPILKGIAEGVKADRPPVRLASTKALATALSDRHVKVVPPDLLVTIMSSIVIPSINLLLDLRLQSLSKHASEEPKSSSVEGSNDVSAATANLTAAEPDATESSEVPSLATQNLSEVSFEDETDEVVVLIRCAAKLFMSNFKRFHRHEAFDVVWLALLKVMLFHEHHREQFSRDSSHASEHQRCNEIASQTLREILDYLDSKGLFTNRNAEGAAAVGHRAQPPPVRNNMWFATSYEIVRAMTTPESQERAAVLFPSFISPSV